MASDRAVLALFSRRCKNGRAEVGNPLASAIDVNQKRSEGRADRIFGLPARRQTLAGLNPAFRPRGEQQPSSSSDQSKLAGSGVFLRLIRRRALRTSSPKPGNGACGYSVAISSNPGASRSDHQHEHNGQHTK